MITKNEIIQKHPAISGRSPVVNRSIRRVALRWSRRVWSHSDNRGAERDRLQNPIFDNKTLMSHRAMAAILGVILQLPPIKKAMASRQMKSRYPAILIERFKN